MRRLLFAVTAVSLPILLGAVPSASAEQVWTKCHISCRCLHDNSVGSFAFAIPVDRSPDIGFDADRICSIYGQRVCSDGCNGTKYSYTYQVTSP